MIQGTTKGLAFHSIANLTTIKNEKKKKNAIVVETSLKISWTRNDDEVPLELQSMNLWGCKTRVRASWIKSSSFTILTLAIP